MPKPRSCWPIVLLCTATLGVLALPACGKDGKGKGKDTEGDTDGMTAEGCAIEPDAEATARPGPQPDGSIIAMNGRRTTAAGPTTFLEGFAHDTIVHPLGGVAYVTTADKRDRRLYVIDTATGDVVQNVDRDEAYYGLAIAPDGSRLYASRGAPTDVEVFDVGVDGTLTSAGAIATSGWTNGLTMSADGATIWAATFDRITISEFDTATLTQTQTFNVGVETWDIQHVSATNELYATNFKEASVVVLDLGTGMVVADIDVGNNPAYLAVNDDGSRVYVTVTGEDELIAIDTGSHQVVERVAVAEDDFVDAQGRPLPNSNPNGLAYDGASDRLYVSRGADSAISVFEASTLTLLGSIPTNYYPADVELSADGASLIVAEGKASGVRGSPRERFEGGLTRIELGGLDLAATTNEVVENYRWALERVDPSTCGDTYPIPRVLGDETPIEHVLLIVKENATFDAYFGAAGEELGVEADPAHLKYDPQTSPNHRAIAKQFTIADNFFLDTVDSDTGHIFLTTTHLTEMVERVWTETDVHDAYPGYRFDQGSRTRNGNFFTWLIEHGIDIQIYGEIIGIMVPYDGGLVSEFSDGAYPGGQVINYGVKDEDKARYIAQVINQGRLAKFSYISLPNDHTNGTSPGTPSPDSMIADNDYATGIIVDALSKSEYWDKSVVFVLQDDPQGASDHVDRDRSFLLVASPWARRGYVSKAHHSYNSVFATIERILGVPPMGRPDAAAGPLWDMFTDVPDTTPYDAVERTFPETLNSEATPGAGVSRCMDFRGPDRNPELGLVNDAYFAWRRGELTKEQAEAMIAAGIQDEETREELEEEAEEETFAFDGAWKAFVEHEVAEGRPAPDLDELLPGLGPAPDCVERPDP